MITLVVRLNVVLIVVMIGLPSVGTLSATTATTSMTVTPTQTPTPTSTQTAIRTQTSTSTGSATPSACVMALSPDYRNCCAGQDCRAEFCYEFGSDGCITVQAQPACCWMAVSSNPSQLTFSGTASGCGQGVVCYDLSPFWAENPTDWRCEWGQGFGARGTPWAGLCDQYTASNIDTDADILLRRFASGEAGTAETDQHELVVYFCGRLAGASSMSACSEAGCATDVTFAVGDPNCTVSCLATCNKGTVPLRAGSSNPIRVCQKNGSCSAQGCVTNDVNGAPLVVHSLSPCTGDCDADSKVSINELVLGVNIVLGSRLVDACQAFRNSQGAVDIAQLIEGVNNAVEGCGG